MKALQALNVSTPTSLGTTSNIKRIIDAIMPCVASLSISTLCKVTSGT